MKWYKRDPDAALVGFRGLSHDAKSAYGTIIDLSYSRDGDVPDDEHLLCMHIECRPQWWRRVKSELIARGKIRIISGKLVANRVETTLKEAQNFGKTQAKRARKGWVSRKNVNGNKQSSLPLGNANTTTTRYKKRACAREEDFNLNFEKDKDDDRRYPPPTKSNNVLKPLPDKKTFRRTQKQPIDNKSPDQNSVQELAAKSAKSEE
jgi:hypothetical protein